MTIIRYVDRYVIQVWYEQWSSSYVPGVKWRQIVPLKRKTPTTKKRNAKMLYVFQLDSQFELGIGPWVLQ